MSKNRLDSDYISAALDEICLNGNAFVSKEELYKKCGQLRHGLRYETFRDHLAEQIREDNIHVEGRRLYATKTWRYEEHAADRIAELPSRSPLPAVVLPGTLTVGDATLCEEQREAVEMAVTCRLSIILGGAGSGKTTLIRGIVAAAGADCHPVLCAPTGKAARNLTARTGLTARTVHSALGMHPDEDFLDAVIWSSVRLVIVDEASMMTLEMLAGILEQAPDGCRVVLVGDGNQLLSVGAGNVLPDLIELGVPVFCLEKNHRQSAGASALLHNVVDFKRLRSAKEMMFDDSFRFIDAWEREAMDKLAKEAARRYLAGESVQVLAPLRRTVTELNGRIRDLVNPEAPEKACAKEFRDGDRVIITQNDRDQDCSNGDVGILHIVNDETGKCVQASVQLPDGRWPTWRGAEVSLGLRNMELAYALTVHKSQGSEYDTILFPALMAVRSMLYRNLFYTAISRAKKQVLLYGSKDAVDVAMRRELPPRKSMLVAKTRFRSELTA